MQKLRDDVRFGLRLLARNPILTGAAILSLALGIGSNTAVFSLVNAVFLKSLGLENPDRLMMVHASEPGQLTGAFLPLSRPDFLDLKARTENVFSSLCEAYDVGARLELGNAEPEIAAGELVSGEYFSTHGITAHLGRLLDATSAGEPEVVLSYRFWKERLRSDPSAIGRVVHLNGQPVTVIGLAPPGFVGAMVLSSTVFWAPISMRSTIGSQLLFDDRHAAQTWAVARLRPGVGPARAEAAVRTVAQSLEEAHPETNRNRRFGVVPLQRLRVPFFLHDRYLRAGGLMMAIVGLVLLVACANTTHLLLARAAARRREIAVRRALGASRRRLLRQLLTESLVLATAAGICGLLVAIWARNGLWALRPADLRNTGLEIGFDARVLGFSLLVTVVTGVLLGLVPALRASRPDLVHDLAGAGEAEFDRSRIWKLRHLLVMSQVALTFLALLSAGLFLKSLGHALEIRPGFEPQGLLTLRLRVEHVSSLDDPAALLDRILEEARGTPAVASASLTSLMPLASGGRWRTAVPETADPSIETDRLIVPTGVVDTDFFATSGIEVARGRRLGAGDRRGDAAVVNETMAARLWPGQDPLGRRFRYLDSEPLHEVVGVIRDVDYHEIGEAKTSIAFLPRPPDDSRARTLVVRTTAAPEALIEPLRRRIHGLEPALPITHVHTGAGIVQERLSSARLGARLLAGLGGVALVLALVGIYGVTTHTTARRTREIAIRMALGAGRRDVVALVVRQGMAVVAVGLGVGIVLAAAGGRFLSGMLYGVSPTDAALGAKVLLVLALVAAAAHVLPAWRASGAHPGRSLRVER